MITERDVQSVLLPVVRYYVLNRQQIQRIGFADDANGRTTRRRIQAVVDAGFITRHTVFPYSPVLGAPAPVYYPTRSGLAFLASHLGDERFLAGNTQAPNANNLLHWLAIGESHIAVDAAIAAQTEVTLEGWINEFDVVNKDESLPEKRFSLYQLLQLSPRLVVAPDAAMLLRVRDFKKVFYLEQDMGTTGVNHLAAARPKGYFALFERKLHRRHFPETNLDAFTILMVTTTANRRDLLRKVFKNVVGAGLWKFVTQSDFTPDKILHAPIFHGVEGAPTPLIKPEANASTIATTQSPEQEHSTETNMGGRLDSPHRARASRSAGSSVAAETAAKPKCGQARWGAGAAALAYYGGTWWGSPAPWHEKERSD